MKKIWIQLWQLCLIIFVGLAGSVTLGLMMYGDQVFSLRGVNFAYVAFGASGAFIFAVYHLYGLSNAITAAVSIGAIQFVVATTWMPTINSVFWSFGVNLPVVWLAFLFERKLSTFRTAKFIVVGFVYGVTFVLLTFLVGVLQKVEAMPAAVFRENFVDGLLIGLGMGLGVQGAEAFIRSLGYEDRSRTA